MARAVDSVFLENGHGVRGSRFTDLGAYPGRLDVNARQSRGIRSVT
jgi:hypothetical protein